MCGNAIGPVRHQPPSSDPEPGLVDGWQPVSGGESDDEVAMQYRCKPRGYEKPTVGRLRKRSDAALDLGGVLTRTEHKLDSERVGIGLSGLPVSSKFIHLGIEENSRARKLRCHLLQHRKPFADNSLLIEERACQISTWPRQAGDQARANRIDRADEHNTDSACRSLQCSRNHHRWCNDHLGLEGDQILGEQPCLLCASRRIAVVDLDIAALRPSKS